MAFQAFPEALISSSIPDIDWGTFPEKLKQLGPLIRKIQKLIEEQEFEDIPIYTFVKFVEFNSLYNSNVIDTLCAAKMNQDSSHLEMTQINTVQELSAFIKLKYPDIDMTSGQFIDYLDFRKRILKTKDIQGSNESRAESLGIFIESLDLSVKVFLSLKRSGLNTVEDILQLLDIGLDYFISRINNFGKKSLAELLKSLKEKGYINEEQYEIYRNSSEQ